MAAEQRFPRELLDQPASTRIEYFRQYTMAHPLLKEASEKLRSAILEPAGSNLVFLFGPTGVGKTTLQQRIRTILIAEMLPEMEADPGRIPFVSIEAVGPDSGSWSWKDFYKRLLIELKEPLIKYKRHPDSRYAPIKNEFIIHPTLPGTELRYALEQALRYRKTTAVMVDEAQHLAKMASGRRFQDQMDSIKSLANMTNTVHVLLGTYELLAFRNLSGQLSRRSTDIHLRRYRADSDEDRGMFLNILLTFQRYLPLKEEPELTQHWEYLYEGSIGCVGILKDWLLRALVASLKSGKETLTIKTLRNTAFSTSQCEKIASEVVEGESIIEEKAGARTRLQNLLGLNMSANNSGQVQIPESQSQPRTPKLKPGIRKPRRDPIGGQGSNA